MTKTRFIPIVTAGVLVALTVAAAPQAEKKKNAPRVNKAIAVLHPLGDNKVSGQVTFTRVEQGIRIQATINGLTPGKHGFHIHEYGDCSSPDGKSAGGHFNPLNNPHAGPMDKMRHVGDMGNIEADASGKATYDMVDPALSFQGPRSILGRGLIVHAGADDLKSQPSGDAGGRVACGVIGVAQGE